MSVYVDDMITCLRNKNWPYSKACHLVADSVEQLRVFALGLGLKPTWYQPKTIPHFDLTASMRRKAIRYGALPISREEFAKFIRKHRQRADK